MRAYSRFSNQQSRKFEGTKRKRKYTVYGLLLLNFLILIFCLARFSTLDYFDIKSVTVKGAQNQITQKIEDQVSKIIVGKYFGLISKSSILTYPKKSLISAISEISPDLQSISIYKDGKNGIIVDVVSKKPNAVVCPTLPNNKEDSDLGACYFVDWSGLIFDKASTSTESIHIYYMPNLADSTSTDSLIGSYATTTSDFIKLENLYKKAVESSLEPDYILLNNNGEVEIYVDDTVVYLNNERSYDEQFENLLTFWNHSKLDRPNVNYEYIDVRYGSNVFFREK